MSGIASIGLPSPPTARSTERFGFWPLSERKTSSRQEPIPLSPGGRGKPLLREYVEEGGGGSCRVVLRFSARTSFGSHEDSETCVGSLVPSCTSLILYPGVRGAELLTGSRHGHVSDFTKTPKLVSITWREFHQPLKAQPTRVSRRDRIPEICVNDIARFPSQWGASPRIHHEFRHARHARNSSAPWSSEAKSARLPALGADLSAQRNPLPLRDGDEGCLPGPSREGTRMCAEHSRGSMYKRVGVSG